MAKIRFRRFPRSSLVSTAAGDGLNLGEPIYLTDEERLVVGTGTSTFVEIPKVGEPIRNGAVTGVSNVYTCDLSTKEHFTITISSNAAATLGVSNWPANGYTGIYLIQLINAGIASTFTFPANWKWILSNGSTSNNFAATGATLNSSGVDFIMIWSANNGTDIYAKIMR